jgi:hypothetical protein
VSKKQYYEVTFLFKNRLYTLETTGFGNLLNSKGVLGFWVVGLDKAPWFKITKPMEEAYKGQDKYYITTCEVVQVWREKDAK